MNNYEFNSDAIRRQMSSRDVVLPTRRIVVPVSSVDVPASKTRVASHRAVKSRRLSYGEVKALTAAFFILDVCMIALKIFIG